VADGRGAREGIRGLLVAFVREWRRRAKRARKACRASMRRLVMIVGHFNVF
jgi:hypothetical protein